MRKKYVDEHRALVMMSEFVAEAHDGQYRKNSVTPYVVHPMVCALMAQKYKLPLRAVLAAMAHDVWEDCDSCWQVLLMENEQLKKMRGELNDGRKRMGNPPEQRAGRSVPQTP